MLSLETDLNNLSLTTNTATGIGRRCGGECSGCVRRLGGSGDNAGALKLLGNMESYGHCMPNHVIYSTIIGMCTLGQQKEAQQMLTEMLRNNITPTVEPYNMFIHM
uniref:Pentatricopeptide repeat-containing protein n=1 Tax=Chenopodium quinoa TaxID=63459 RepID=A0A803KNV3_CHEQI